MGGWWCCRASRTATGSHRLRAENRDGDGVFCGAHVERGNWEINPVSLTKSDADFAMDGAEFVKGYSDGDFGMEELNDLFALVRTYFVLLAEYLFSC